MTENENRGADDERVSMWSVPRRFRRVYFQLFYSLGIIGIGWSVWYEASRLGNGASYHDLANAVIQKAPAIIFTTAFISLMTTEVSMVLAEMVSEYFKKRRDAAAAEAQAKGLAEGIEKGKAEGVAQGEAIGAERMGRKWAAWYRKRMEAEERGEDFDEPPPSSHDLNGTDDDKPSE